MDAHRYLAAITCVILGRKGAIVSSMDFYDGTDELKLDSAHFESVECLYKVLVETKFKLKNNMIDLVDCKDNERGLLGVMNLVT